MADRITAMPAEIVEWLSQQTDTFGEIKFLTEFPATPKATPLRHTIVSVGLESVKISDYFVENSEGVLVPDEYCRRADIKLRFSIYVPYSAGGTACHAAFTKIVDALNFKSDMNLKSSSCEKIEADRDTDAFVMKCFVDVEAQFCPSETSAVAYQSLLPKTLFCQSHINDTDIHVTPQEKASWGSPVTVGYYFGNGESLRYFNLGFSPRFILVTRSIVPPFYNEMNGESYCCMGMATESFSSAGIEVTFNGFKIMQGENHNFGTTRTQLNKFNMDYFYVAFK